ncbi:ImmA/IrrE family metallo-endopeptidase [Neomoorella mulderi]|uniref:Double zinc ribbon n=1 Tax=Moorella mulderi DSM 14980 TaxID=1122241 RepID=A0A151AWF6_9FIRM|nr:ImmA/IrrE family metallo-endopeptidase [Moorella mulderi]KYH31892.1 double zinc ribbon [Moorella mulderi DSM 14980]
MGKKRPRRVRKAQAIAAARFLRQQLGLVEYNGIDARQVLKQVAVLKIFSSSQDPDFIHEEGFTRSLGNGKYEVYVNRDLPEGRDNWTYGHETAHIVLKHHEEFDVDNLLPFEHWILNREANIFTTEYLMPEDKFRQAVRFPLTISEIARLKNIFKVSWQAVINRLDELHIYPKAKIEQLFCEQRRAKKEVEMAIATVAVAEEKGQVYAMQKDVLRINLDENMRFTICPRCGNTDFSEGASYCKMCGLFLYNDCIECHAHNVADARYCEYCGNETTLFKAGILKPCDDATLYIMLEELLSREVVTEFDQEGNLLAIRAKTEEDDLQISEEDLPF